MDVDQAGSLVGAALILWAYGAQQFGRMAADGFAYSLLNVMGGAVLAAVAATNELWGFVILNSVWALVSIRTMVLSNKNTRRVDG